MSSTGTDYESLPYESIPVPGMDPVQLSLSSFLHGGPRPPVEGFRLLELGCGWGMGWLRFRLRGCHL